MEIQYKENRQDLSAELKVYILGNGEQVKVIRECLIKHFTFYYNSAYAVYKDAKYSIGQQL